MAGGTCRPSSSKSPTSAVVRIGFRLGFWRLPSAGKSDVTQITHRCQCGGVSSGLSTEEQVMKRTIAGAFVAVSLITSAANAQTTNFPLQENDTVEFLGVVKKVPWYAERGSNPLPGDMFNYLILRGPDQGDPYVVEFYLAQCTDWVYAHPVIRKATTVSNSIISPTSRSIRGSH
jgi:hypothetical protein